MFKGKIKINRFMYPKVMELDSSQWSIVTANVVSTLEGEAKLSKYNTITLKGMTCPCKVGDELYFEGKSEYDEKYKCYNYSIIVLADEVEKVEPTFEDLSNFLDISIKNEQVIKDILSLDDVLNIFETKDIISLQKVKGIGEVRAKKLVSEYHNSKSTFRYTSHLSKWGITKALLNKLIGRYGTNIREIYNKVKENPYILADEVSGIGFKKADDIAIKMGEKYSSVNRYKSFILYHLNSEATNGKAYVFNSDLMASINENLGIKEDVNRNNLKEAIYSLKDEGKLWWSDDKNILALSSIREIEKKLALEIKRLNTVDSKNLNYDYMSVVRDIEKQQGWNYSKQQLEGIEATIKNNFVLVTGLAGCVDCDTEYLSEYEGWKKISDYKEGERILQYNLDGTASFVEPYEYIKTASTDLIKIKTLSNRVNQVLSPNHNFVHLNKSLKLTSKPFYEVIDIHNRNKIGFSGRVITTFNYNGDGIELTDAEIKVMVMVLADGSFTKCATNRCRLFLKKERKIIRAEQLLKEANIEYSKSVTENYTSFSFLAPRKEKNFENYWYKASNHQLKLICDEVLLWDGHVSSKNRRTFYTNNKCDADFIQFAFSSIGYRATINEANRVGEKIISYITDKTYIRKKKEYYVNISIKGATVGIKGDCRNDFRDKASIENYKTLDGYMYCFSVPSSMLVLRRENRIFITGNSGKTTVSSAMTKILVDNLNYSIKQCTLSGKASCRLAQVSGKEAQTIHRLLEYSPTNGFLRNENNKLECDILIVDEVSMVDTKLMLSLLSAIKTGTKVIFLGDYGQLQSISLGKILKTLIDTSYIKVVKLDTVYRQGKTSAINTNAIKIRNGEQLVPRHFEGELIYGDLKDFELICYNDRDEIITRTIEEFKKHYEKVKDIMEVQICTSTRTRGNISSYTLNRVIKNIYNPISDGEPFVKVSIEFDKCYYISKNDKVIITKNNYKASIWDSFTNDFVEGSIFNGSMGIVRSVEQGYIYIDIEDVGLVRLAFKDLDSVELGYAVTTWKLQGSQFNTVIIPIDFSAYTLLSRELLYTSITRASKHCVVVAETNALIKSISTKEADNKNTFLDGLLMTM